MRTVERVWEISILTHLIFIMRQDGAMGEKLGSSFSGKGHIVAICWWHWCIAPVSVDKDRQDNHRSWKQAGSKSHLVVTADILFFLTMV